LTIKGITKEVKIPVEISGPVKKRRFGDMAIGFGRQFRPSTARITAFPLTRRSKTGGVMVGNDVKVDISIEAHKK